MKKYKNHTVSQYLEQLSLRVPAPGGGSAAALVGALGAALISMVANYSLSKKNPKPSDSRIKALLLKSEKLRKRLLELVDLDAQAYLGVVKTRQASEAVKQRALKKACDVPREVCRLCLSAVELTPFLVKNGNRHLMSDIKVALELLTAAFDSALLNIETNQ